MSGGDARAERFILHLKPLQGALEAFCRRSLYEPSLVEDVLQEAVTRAFRDFGLFSEGTNFRAWIFRYLELCILEANRKHPGRPPQPATAEPATEDEWALESDESVLQMLLESPEVFLEQCDDDLNRAVLELYPVERAVLLLKAIGEFKYREIAAIIGVPLGTVMSSLARARRQVRHALTGKGGGHGQFPPHTDGSDHRIDP